MNLTDTHGRPGAGLLLSAGAAVAAAGAAWKVASRRQQRQASKLHRVLVELLLNALSSGDPATARHSRRVANLADVLAEVIRMGPEEHATLRVAALLHDMGKIEDELFPLVHSSRPLSEPEREQINHHPCESAAILRPLEPFHRGLTGIVAAHHECWNGQGYPSGLRGEQIPLAARVISLADVFDALTQPRSYHEPRPIPEVLDEIRAGAGQRFDPSLAVLLDDPAIRGRWIEIAEAGRREEEAASRNDE
jgi:putative nucleotidyltransferase with HDIG domain